MKAVVRYSLFAVLVAAFCTGMFLLLRQTREQHRSLACSQLEVSFADSLRFINEQDIREYIDTRYGSYVGERLDSMRLQRIEDMLESHSAIMRCEAWTTDDGTLHVEIAQRAPVLRFMDGEKGFYVDADGYIFPLHESYTASVPVVEGTIPVDVPAGYKGEAPSEAGQAWIEGMLTLNRIISTSRNWQFTVTQVRVQADGELAILLDGRNETFLLGQPVDIPDKFNRIDRYLGSIAPRMAEGWYKIVNVKYNQQIICRQKDT